MSKYFKYNEDSVDWLLLLSVETCGIVWKGWLEDSIDMNTNYLNGSAGSKTAQRVSYVIKTEQFHWSCCNILWNVNKLRLSCSFLPVGIKQR